MNHNNCKQIDNRLCLFIKHRKRLTLDDLKSLVSEAHDDSLRISRVQLDTILLLCRNYGVDDGFDFAEFVKTMAEMVKPDRDTKK